MKPVLCRYTGASPHALRRWIDAPVPVRAACRPSSHYPSSSAAAAQPPAARRPDAGPLPSIEEKTAGLKKLDGYFPLYWDERTGQLWLEMSRFDTEVLHSSRLRCGPRLERHRPRSRRPAPARASSSFERVGPKVLLVQPNLQFRAVGASAAEARAGGGRVRAVGAVGLHGGRRDQRAACSSTPPTSSCATPRRRRAPASRALPRRPDAQRDLPADDAELPEEHRDGGRADVRDSARRRAALPAGGGDGRAARASGAGGAFFEGVRHRAPRRPKRPPCACTSRWSSCPTATTSRAWTIRVRATWRVLQGLLRAARHRSQHVATWPATGCRRRTRRPPISDPVKPIVYYLDPGRARADPLGAARRRALVEPGVRGRRLPERVPRGAAARGRQPARHPLQHDQLGAPLDARLEHGRRGHRSAHRRDHQGRRHARLAARSARTT